MWPFTEEILNEKLKYEGHDGDPKSQMSQFHTFKCLIETR